MHVSEASDYLAAAGLSDLAAAWQNRPTDVWTSRAPALDLRARLPRGRHHKSAELLSTRRTFAFHN